ncbi:MAG: T9SS type A sorting domain-containing protein [Bacteroidia bacterium]
MKNSLLHLLSRLLVIVTILGGSAVQAQSLNVDLAEDSIYSCLWAPITLSPIVSGQQGNLTWTWSTGDTTATVYLLPTAIGNDTIIVSVSDDATAAVAHDTIIIFVLAECVLPGDADGNGLANNFDVLPIGRSFNSVGPLRPNAHNNFIGQAAPDWGSLNSAGVDQVHSDANGDGVIEWQDFEVIEFNYFQAQSMGASGTLPSGVPFYVDFPTGPFTPGDTIKAPIILGSISNPANNIIGIAFSIDYDKSLIDSGSVRIEYTDSWLGDNDIDMATLDKDFYQKGQVDVGISRTNQIARTGYGKVGDIIVAIDDIAGKQDFLNTDIGLIHVSLLDQQGSFIEVDTDRSNIQIAMSVEKDDFSDQRLNIYPNPATGTVQFEIASLPYSGRAELVVFDQLGRMVKAEELLISNNNNSLDISQLATGIYTVNIYIKNQIFSNRLSVL